MLNAYDILSSATANGTALASIGGAFSDRISDLAVTAVWQGALVACGLALCLRLAPRVSAAHRFAVWTAAFLTLVGLPMLAVIVDIPLGTSMAALESAGTAARPWLSFDSRWSLLIAGVWVLASLMRAADLVIHSWKLRKTWREATPVAADARVKAVLDRVNGSVEVCTTRALDRPSVIGFFKPRILIPDWLFARLTPGELEQIVMHEAEHLRRRDDWTNLLQKLCLVVFPLNPALIWIERRLCREREMACDEGVIRITRAPRAYAACLASLAERGLERRAAALSLGAWQRRPELVHRVHSILRGKRGLSPKAARVLLGTVGCALLIGAVELAQCPQLVAFVPERNAQSQLASLADDSAPTTAAIKDPGDSGKDFGLRQTEVLSRTGVGAVPVVFRSSAKPIEANAVQRRPVARLNAPVNAPIALRNAAVQHRDHGLRAITLKAEMRPSEPTAAMEQQWLVLTTWRVETTSRSVGQRSDYDRSESAEQKADAAASMADSQQIAKQALQPASRITVTRLILRVIPASAETSSQTNSLTGQPGEAAMRGGWLVFQL